jgi:hypothetical protein
VVVRFRQSPPSKSHAVLLHAASQNLSPIQLDGQPSAQLGTGQDKYTCHRVSASGGNGGRPPGPPVATCLLATSMCVKVLGPDMVAKQNVIIQVDKLAGQAGDPVQVRLDGRRARPRGSPVSGNRERQ